MGILKDSLTLDNISPDDLRKSAPQSVGIDFAEVASDADIMKMASLKYEILDIYNAHIASLKSKINVLRGEYGLDIDKRVL